jgi:metal-responsive CopG/Arc/MetJ family transcriptional regulator
MARTIIDLPISPLRDLDALCGSLGVSRAEAVRRAVQAFLQNRSDRNQTGFGLWRNESDASGEDSQSSVSQRSPATSR